MNTEIIKIDENNIDKDADLALQRAGRILREGGLVAFPTETVYGLGGDAANAESSRKIYAAKGRPSDNPLIVHIYRTEDLYELTEELPETALRLAKAFWPGPLTMIIKKSPFIPLQTTGGLETVAVRMPSNKIAAKLIEYAGGFVAAPSANASGRPSPTVAKYCIEDLDGKVDMIIDGGAVGIGLESTIVDLTVDTPMILRPGYITEDMLRDVLGEIDVDKTIIDSSSKEKPKAPGMKYRHYAPKGDLTIVEGKPEDVVEYINGQTAAAREKGLRTGVIASHETVAMYKADSIMDAGSKEDEETVARQLFMILREFDDLGTDVIYSESFDTSGIGQAIMNRLLKAAGQHIIRV
ncbi:L-threonylcarbamoyladenylate synthase [Butyrivibrio sp. MC2013]|uniref:L-threonylcarbamoyladenylate synthase n=1 Tax=Butyrivibrio sp. MC2013 TaxID=1280686 RepID=UPI0004252F56|nr:L-threonylcarbamoyladenylate synthase [Butyrivibrio sp. MC2013]